jgi:hypothetical protein
MYMSKIEICFITAWILQNQRMLCCGDVLYQNRSPHAVKRENWQFVDLSRLQFTSDESEFIPDYI